ncbi:MAG TPA: putative molybdenum carrier protein [Pirellulales bacterium]|nr:putative molybdenum carrier protein [Pirellulales bacterium]
MISAPVKIVSGGQAGADRAALDVAIELAIEHGGWVPRGRWAEDGPLPPRYRMQESESAQPAERTEGNVRDSDATLIFSHGPPTGGTALTARVAERLRKPALSIDLAVSDEAAAARDITAWLQRVRPQVLNVAGPRASNDPLIYDAVSRVLRRVLSGHPGG